ncbi:sorting nexin-11 [Nematolebias whitei]|uniref:sorting nexin-11 n=1 Tax=Nematolebias whitei TaxID=451745 RepID=UPI00189A2A76|nr:sorting nexin-11 [Nematolebias whitei]
MSRNHVDDEFVAVRVQDPRIQNEGSWRSYVDFKIFLHTNSKAFTAKTSCVRRRYSEFEWLKKKLQKNAGLVPVPDLPGKSFFYFSNEDFLERRRKGLQDFLNKVVHMTVCLSDSQLHLFLQTQLPVGHIQDCVQGLTPFSVTDAILTYASSNRGLAQAQEEESIREHSLTISYESMESPVPHQPNVTPNPDMLPCEQSNPPVDVLDSDETLHKKKPSLRISQKSNHLEVVVEDHELSQATFYVGESPSDSGSLSSVEQMEQRSCLIRTPVDVHSPMDVETVDRLGSKENRVHSEPEMFVISEEISPSPEDFCSEKLHFENHVTFQVYEGQRAERDRNSDGPGAKREILLRSEITVETLNASGAPEVEPTDSIPEVLQQEVEHGVKEETALEIHQKSPSGNNTTEVERSDSGKGKQHMDEDEILQETLGGSGAPEVEPSDSVQGMLQQEVEHTDMEESPSSNGDSAPEVELSGLVQEAETSDRDEVLQSEVHVETPNVNGAPEVEPDHLVQEKHKQEVDRNDVLLQSQVHVETRNVNGAPEVEPGEWVQGKQEVERADKGESNSLTSSTESIMKCSEEESVCGDTEDSVTSSPEDVRNWSGGDAFNENAPELHLNGTLEGKGDTSDQEDGEQRVTNVKDLVRCPEPRPADGRLTGNILESSCLTGGDNGKFTKQEAPPSMSGSDETRW